MSLFNPKNEEEEEQYLPAKLTDQLPDQSLSEEVRDRLRKKGYKRRLRIFSDVIAPMKILGFVLIFISLSYLIVTQLKYLFFQTSYFELKDFEVVGNSVLDSDYILKKAGIAPAQNVFSLETDEIRQRLLEEPLIKDIKVELSSLNSLRISVTERTPIIYAKKGIAFYEISEDGVILNTEGMGEKDAFKKNLEDRKKQLEELKEAISKQASQAGTSTNRDVRTVNDIGTAKPTTEEMQGIKHYLIDVVSPDERYSVSNFKIDCEKAIEEILKNYLGK